jgi:hypothetical protein
MVKCPHCETTLSLDFLDSLMDELRVDKMDSEVIVDAPCCRNELKGIAKIGMYYLAPYPEKPYDKAVMIGAE